MEIKINLEISFSPAVIQLLTGLTPPSQNGKAEAKEEKAVKELKTAATKEKKAEAGTAKKITLSDLRQLAVKDADSKAKIKAILATMNLEEPKLQFLPEDKIEEVYNKMLAPIDEEV
jgi:hypothetical protein